MSGKGSQVGKQPVARVESTRISPTTSVRPSPPLLLLLIDDLGRYLPCLQMLPSSRGLIERFFNTVGPCNPEDHYMLPWDERLPSLEGVGAVGIGAATTTLTGGGRCPYPGAPGMAFRLEVSSNASPIPGP